MHFNVRRDPYLSPMVQTRWTIVAVLGIIVLLGALLRLHDLGKSTISHEEIFVPGIELPDNLSEPRPRTTLKQSIISPILEEPHPGGYYVFMFGWTKLFGTSILALRLPSVLFGITSILLIYALGTLEKDRLTGLLAAGMLAASGPHIFWSQIAKGYIMACFLGLLSTLLLLLWISKSGPWQRVYQVLYLIVILAGLATEIFYWPLFFTHILWVLGNILLKQKSLLGLFRWQMLILILGSPLLGHIILRSGRSSYLLPNLLTGLGQFLQFGFLLQPKLFDPEPEHLSRMPDSTPAVLMIIFLFAVAMFLLIVNLKSKRNRFVVEIPIISSPPSIVIVMAGIFAMLATLWLVKLSYDHGQYSPKKFAAVIIIPVLLLLLNFLVRRYWRYLQALGVFLSKRLGTLSDFNLTTFLAIIPVVAIAGVSLYIPIFDKRTVLLFIPYLLITLAIGLAFLIRQHKRWIALVLVLAVFHSVSVVHYKHQLHSPVDYKGLAEQWIPRIKDSDLIFVQRHFATTPIFYYVNADRYRFVHQDYAQEIHKYPDSRIWLLSFKNVANRDVMRNALADYELIMSLEALRIKAELYQPQSATIFYRHSNNIKSKHFHDHPS